MTKKQFSFLFTVISTLVNIVISLAIIVALIVLTSLVLSKAVGVKNGNVYMVVWMLCFVAGIILGMIIFSKLCTFAIDRWFYDKLDKKIIGRYTPKNSSGRTERSQRNESDKPKTNMPDSVKPKQDTFGQY